MVDRLKKRRDFLALRSGPRVAGRGFVLQAGRRSTVSAQNLPEARFGFTVTKKVGNAVERNRIKRRLKEAVRVTEGLAIDPACDYVLVARRAALTMPFDDLQSDLRRMTRQLARRLSGDKKATD